MAFRNINDEVINRIESFVRNDLLRILIRKCSHENTSLDIIDKKVFFGAYENNIAEFEFTQHNRDLILKLVSCVVEKVDSLGIKDGQSYFHDPVQTELTPINNWHFADKQDISGCVLKNENDNVYSDSQTHRILNKLLDTSNQNYNRPKQGYRFEKEVTMFAVYFRMLSGRMAYETLQKNMPLALPSLSSTDYHIHKSNNRVIEGILRRDELLLYLNERNQPLIVSLSEDATRIDNRVQYDKSTNQLIGFVLPINKANGMPKPFSYKSRSSAEMIYHFSSGAPTAKFVNTIMAKPMGKFPPFCLLIFGSDNKYSAIDVANRWTHIEKELAKVGILVLTISSDSDPKYNGAMRMNSMLGNESHLLGDSMDDLFRLGKKIPPFYVQDTPHNGTKLRCFLLATIEHPEKLPFGKYFIKMEHLQYLVDNFGKDKHQLTNTTLNPIDRQNFSSVLRFVRGDTSVIDLLENHVKDSQATVLFLKIMRNFIFPFMDQTIPSLQRLKSVWYSIFIIRLWRKYVHEHPGLTLKKNFLSSYCYNCLELNAHSLVAIMVYLKESNQSKYFMPWIFNSQACESFYRQIRSFTSTYSTVASCSVNEIMHRVNRIMLQSRISNDLSQNFIFPRSLSNSHEYNNFLLPTRSEIIQTINESKAAAIEKAIEMGIAQRKRVNCSLDLLPYSSKLQKRSRMTRLIEPNAWNESLSIKSIQLKNFADKFKLRVVTPESSYVEIINSRKRMVVKKTSLCWLLRRDYVKLSSDRLKRVQTECTIGSSTKRTKKSRSLKIYGKKWKIKNY